MTESRVTRAVILAAGTGSRLREGGDELPKPLRPVLGVPLCVRVLRALEASGIREAVIVTGHDGERLRRVLSSEPSLGLKLNFVHNPRFRPEEWRVTARGAEVHRSRVRADHGRPPVLAGAGSAPAGLRPARGRLRPRRRLRHRALLRPRRRHQGRGSSARTSPRSARSSIATTPRHGRVPHRPRAAGRAGAARRRARRLLAQRGRGGALASWSVLRRRRRRRALDRRRHAAGARARRGHAARLRRRPRRRAGRGRSDRDQPGGARSLCAELGARGHAVQRVALRRRRAQGRARANDVEREPVRAEPARGQRHSRSGAARQPVPRRHARSSRRRSPSAKSSKPAACCSAPARPS